MNLELLVVETTIDALAVALCDIYDFVIDDTECENCGMLVGPVNNDFFPCVIAVTDVDDAMDDERDVTVVCVDCAGPILFPGFKE